MIFTNASSSRPGARREVNQDVVLIDEKLGVYILCDGMGGTAGGGIAATRASQECLRYLQANSSELSDISSSRDHHPSDRLSELAQAAIQAANHAVHSHNQEHAELCGSGTTIALLITAGTHGVCAHVGDSRIYVNRNQSFLQLTKDHSLAQDLIDRGLLDPNNLDNFAFKHVLSRAVGLLPAVSADTLHFEILPGDLFLIASTDLNLNVLAENSPRSNHRRAQLFLEAVISSALASHGDDDLSAIVVEAASDDRERDIHQARSEELELKTSVLSEVFLFNSLDPQNILRIVNAATLITCHPGAAIVTQGDPEMSLYIILEGNFDVEISDQKIAQLHRGNHFGEMALLTSHPRSATVRAATSGKVLRLAAKEFQRLVQAHPQDGVKMITALAKELSDRLRQTNQFLAER